MIDKQRLRTFLLGGAVGALAGILIAPRSGRELRSNISNRAGEAREKSRETYFETQEHLQERLARTREAASARPERDPEVSVGAETPPGRPEVFTGPPRLRDVSSDLREEEDISGMNPEELRRKVQETRARLRERLGSSGQGVSDVEKDPDE
ncbi:hypothetical protein BH24ACT22_BH24ACT22_03130 [soil metagenome]